MGKGKVKVSGATGRYGDIKGTYRMERIFWIGPRESDIYGLGSVFFGSITLYGSNQGRNIAYCAFNDVRINHNIDHPDSTSFILERQLEMIQRYPDCKFMTYNPNYMRNVPDPVMERMICLNPRPVLEELNDKKEFRAFARDIVPMLKACTVPGRDCSYAALRRADLWTDSDTYVIQETVSSGGHGTYYLTPENEREVLGHLDPEKEYLATGFVEHNIPVNIHAVIYDRDIVLFPASVQIIVPSGGRLLYRGADFPTFERLPACAKEQFAQSVSALCKEIQRKGYRGVLGVDGMWTESGIYILEVNNRFQGSTHLLDLALSEAGLPSVQECTMDAFRHLEMEEDVGRRIRALRVPYSSFVQINENGGFHGRYLLDRIGEDPALSKIFLDGYRKDQPIEDQACQYSLVFRSNIVSLCDRDTKVRLHPSLPAPTREWDAAIRARSLTELKIGLINQGVTISPAAKAYIQAHGEMREGTYFSLDLFLEGAYVNCPLSTKLVSFSPYSISVNAGGDGLCLRYYGEVLLDVDYDRRQPWTGGTPAFDKICFFATDRLRLQNNAYCTFPRNGVGCRFCEMTGALQGFTRQDILDAIDACFALAPRPFRHILIGGASNDPGKEHDTIIAMCRRIRTHEPEMPIYLMCLPPRTREEVEDYVRAGVTEFGFNMEVFDRTLAKTYMPGKGMLSQARYLDALKWAAELVGKEGAVRCAFIAGLEPMDLLLDGIREVCRCGAAPILSVFRPIPHTQMEEEIPPSNEWLMELLERGEEICRGFGLSLGPECPACRNNTLTAVRRGEALGYRRQGY